MAKGNTEEKKGRKERKNEGIVKREREKEKMENEEDEN